MHDPNNRTATINYKKGSITIIQKVVKTYQILKEDTGTTNMKRLKM
jgi:hypothetical protein